MIRKHLASEQAELTPPIHHYSRKVEEARGDSKSMFKIIRQLLSSQHNKQLPLCNNDEKLSNELGSFFEEKIDNMRRNFNIDP